MNYELNHRYRAFFFDVDGTLVSFKTHTIPQSAVDALTEAKRSGIGIYISTGRPARLVNNLGPIEHLIDGYITANGACCMTGGEVKSCLAIPHDEVLAALRMADDEGFPMMLVGERDLKICNPDAASDRIFRQLLNVSYTGDGVSRGDVLAQRIVQLTPIISPEAEQRLMPLLPGCVSARWHPDFTDITARGADKGSALHTMAALLGIDISQTVAFGDGGNDMSILREAGLGIAMGNASDEVKAVADRVTSSVDDDGIAKAVKELVNKEQAI